MRIQTGERSSATTAPYGRARGLQAAVVGLWHRQLAAWEVFDRQLAGEWTALPPPAPARPASDPEIAAALRAERIANDYHPRRPRTGRDHPGGRFTTAGQIGEN